MIAAAEAAGFGAVELLGEAVAAVSAPVPGFRPTVGDLILVYDFGATFEATLIRVGEDFDEVLGHQSIVDPGMPADAAAPGQHPESAPPPVEHTIACCHDLLGRLGVNPRNVRAVLPVGGGFPPPGLAAALDRGLGIPICAVDEPELAVVRGAAHGCPAAVHAPSTPSYPPTRGAARLHHPRRLGHVGPLASDLAMPTVKATPWPGYACPTAPSGN